MTNSYMKVTKEFFSVSSNSSDWVRRSSRASFDCETWRGEQGLGGKHKTPCPVLCSRDKGGRWGAGGGFPGKGCCHVEVSDFSRRQGEVRLPSLVRGAEMNPLQELDGLPPWGTGAALSLGDMKEKEPLAGTGSLHLRRGGGPHMEVSVVLGRWGMLWHSYCVTCKQQGLLSLGSGG